jgi:hypothetical protein
MANCDTLRNSALAEVEYLESNDQPNNLLGPSNVSTSYHLATHYHANIPLSTPDLSEDAIVEMILNDRDGCQRIQIPGVDEALYDRIKIRTNAISERLRYYYNLTSCTIIIDTLPSDIHESLQEYLVDMLKYLLSSTMAGETHPWCKSQDHWCGGQRFGHCKWCNYRQDTGYDTRVWD